MNPTLRLAVKKLNHLICLQQILIEPLKKVQVNYLESKYDDFEFEGYGPHSVAILIEVMTDNKNRTLPEIRSIMAKNGGNLGESGCVNWIFLKKAIFTIQIDKITEDHLMELLEDSNVEDIIFEEFF